VASQCCVRPRPHDVAAGQTGIKEIRTKTLLLSAMHASLGEKSGMYMFPGMGWAAVLPASKEGRDATLREKLAANPSGLLISILRAPKLSHRDNWPLSLFTESSRPSLWSFCWRNAADQLWLSCGICDPGGRSRGPYHKYLLLELVRLSATIPRLT